MPFALVEESGRVAQIEATDAMPVAPPLTWISCGAEVETEWVYDDPDFHAPPWPEPPLIDGKAEAKRQLGQYYVAYSRSQFTAGSETFAANDPSAFLVIAEVLRIDPTNTSQVVFDIEGDPHPVANPTAWGQFWDKYVALFDTARGIVGPAWQDVKVANTNAEIKAILDALPPIPGA